MQHEGAPGPHNDNLSALVVLCRQQELLSSGFCCDAVPGDLVRLVCPPPAHHMRGCTGIAPMAPCHADRPVHDPQPTANIHLMYSILVALRAKAGVHSESNDRAEAYQSSVCCSILTAFERTHCRASKYLLRVLSVHHFANAASACMQLCVYERAVC
jgi:hypothetical protein